MSHKNIDETKSSMMLNIMGNYSDGFYFIKQVLKIWPRIFTLMHWQLLLIFLITDS